MPSTDSGHPKKVADIHWIEWSTCSGIGGRHPPDSLAAMRRITQQPLILFTRRISFRSIEAKY